MLIASVGYINVRLCAINQFELYISHSINFGEQFIM
jgi:hypothetical protein